MVHDSLSNLQLDRRMIRRRGWIKPEELSRALEALEDVAAKAELVGDDEEPDAGQTPPPQEA